MQEAGKIKVAVIGGGPSGMMAAIAASENGADVTLFEKNEKLGKKLYISGKGRCNVTNNCSVRDFVLNVATNGKFLLGALNKLTPQDTVSFFENNGLTVKTERGNRVFPCSDKSSDVIKTLERVMRRLGVKICLNSAITDVTYKKNAFLLTNITDIISFDRVIIATGGLSYSATGSTGDGYRFAGKLGHNVTALRPALCRIRCKDVAELEGLSLKNVAVSALSADGEVIAREFGEMLFAKDAVSGPAVLTLSSRINTVCLSGGKLTIDLKPALDFAKLDARLIRDFSERMNRDFINSLGDLLPERLIKEVARQSGIPFSKKVNQITAVERRRLAESIKNLSFTLTGLDDIEYGIVTAGGVDVKQVNPATMESKLIGGLFFCGETLDVDAFTGGYNIQIALSTGYVAGKSAAANQENDYGGN